MSIQIRNDINLITESIAINEAWQELPREVREDLNTIIAEMQRLDEAPLQPAQIQTVFQQMVAQIEVKVEISKNFQESPSTINIFIC